MNRDEYWELREEGQHLFVSATEMIVRFSAKGGDDPEATRDRFLVAVSLLLDAVSGTLKIKGLDEESWAVICKASWEHMATMQDDFEELSEEERATLCRDVGKVMSN